MVRVFSERLGKRTSLTLCRFLDQGNTSYDLPIEGHQYKIGIIQAFLLSGIKPKHL